MGHGFEGSYEAVKRYVNRVKAREPRRVWRVEVQTGEEVQVDFMQGPMVETTHVRHPLIRLPIR